MSRNNNRYGRNSKGASSKQNDRKEAKEAAAMKGCACALVALKFENDNETQKSPGVVKAKVYFQRSNKAKMTEILRHLYIGRSEKQEDQKNILSQFEINPETCDPRSLLNFDRSFDGAGQRRTYSSYIDVNLRTPLPIVMIEVLDRLNYGRVSFVSAGKRNQDNDAKTLAVMQKWTPLWTRRVSGGSKNERGYLATKVFSPQDFDCDTIRFQFEFSEEIARYNFVRVKDVEMRGYNSQEMITRPQPKKNDAPTTSKLPSDACSVNSFNLMKMPTEIWEKIFNFLPEEDRLKTLSYMASTCQDWRRFFRHPRFYRELDLKPVATLLSSKSVDYLRFLSEIKGIEKLRISWVPTFPQDFNLGHFLEWLPPSTLKCLVAENCGALDDSVLAKLAKYQPNLETLSLHGCFAISSDGYKEIAQFKQLRHLSIGNTDTIGYEALRLIAKNCTKLEVFECADLLRIYPYRDENAADVMQEFLSSLASLDKLRAINVEVNFKSKDYDDGSSNSHRKVEKTPPKEDEVTFMRNFLSKCPNVEEFYLNGGINADRLLKAFDDRSFKSLRRFSRLTFPFHHEESSDDDEGDRPPPKQKEPIELKELVKMAATLPNLERLALFDEDSEREWKFDEILKNCPKLRQLFIWQSSSDLSVYERRQGRSKKKGDVIVLSSYTVDKELQSRFPNCLIVKRPAEFNEDEDYYEGIAKYGEWDWETGDELEDAEVDGDYHLECYELDSDDEKMAWYMQMNAEYAGDDDDDDYY